MSRRVDGKVAFVTGAARGQGRSHALKLAEEGADIIAVDLCAPIDSVDYGLASEADLADTVKLVQETGRRIIATQADVRDQAALTAAVDNGVASLAWLDIVVANAGILSIITERSHARADLAGHDRCQPHWRVSRGSCCDSAPDRQAVAAAR